MAKQVVKVRRDLLEACMRCPLCNKLMKEATTVSLCLHTFCRKCIYEKLSDEGIDSCPVCDIELGCLPLEKLRPDHNLQDIRAKLFPHKRRKVDASEVTMPSTSPPPTKRKERSLSSLVVSAPKVSPKMPVLTGLTGRRSKATARKASALKGCSFTAKGPEKKDDADEHQWICTRSPDGLSKTNQNKQQELSPGEPDSKPTSNKDLENDVERMEGKADLWTPLNCLLEAANKTKTSKVSLQGYSLTKSEPSVSPDCKPGIPETRADEKSSRDRESELYTTISKNKKHGEKAKVQDGKKHGGQVKRRKLQAAARQMGAMLSAMQAMQASPQDKFGRRNRPVWFSLIASEDQRGDASLPQIPSCYLRIKDGKMPVSFIQKYLVKKLDLTSEAEVEIRCRGQAVVPTQQLNNLVDLWSGTAPSKRQPLSVGSSAKDFVMVLSYSRKLQSPPP